MKAPGPLSGPFPQDERWRQVAKELLQRARIPESPPATCAPSYSEQDRYAVLRVLDGEGVWRLNSEASCRLVETFRQKVNGAKHLLPTASASAALHVALTYLIRTRGPRVLLPSWTWYGVAATVLNAGGTPIFADLDPDTLRIVPSFEYANPDCALVSHLFGVPSLDGENLASLKKRGIEILEDCAQALHGAVDAQHGVGNLGVASAFSFNGSKAIPAGEGGMLATEDDGMAEHFFNFTMSVASPKEVVIRRFNDAAEGWNVRLASLPASLAESLIHSLPARTQAGRRAHDSLIRILAGRTWLAVMGMPLPPDFSPLGCPVRLRKPVPGLGLAESRAILYFAVRFAGIPASVWVPDAIPKTRLLRSYYETTNQSPDAGACAGADLIADSHIVFGTSATAAAHYDGNGRLAAVLDAFESILHP